MANEVPSGQTGGNVSAPTVGSAPLGTEPVSGARGSTGASSTGAAGALNQPAAGAPISLSDDTMVVPPGAKDPVRYGDYYRNFQSQFTRKAQEAAEARKQIQAAQRRIQELEAGRNVQQQQAQPNKLQALAQQLQSLTYLNGEQAAGVVNTVLGEMQAQAGELRRRDMALALMYNRMKQMGEVLDQLHGRTSETDFNTKIAGFVKQAGLPQRATEWAKTYYVAHEGADLDREFPRMLKEAWNNLQAIQNEERTQRAQQARQAPFVPGKGGNGTASRPLSNLTSRSSARDIANALWPSMVDGETET